MDWTHGLAMMGTFVGTFIGRGIVTKWQERKAKKQRERERAEVLLEGKKIEAEAKIKVAEIEARVQQDTGKHDLVEMTQRWAEKLLEELESQRKVGAEREQKIVDLTATVRAWEDRAGQMDEHFQQFRKDFDKLKAEHDALRAEHAECPRKIAKLEQEHRDCQKRLETLEAGVKRVISTEMPVVKPAQS